MFCCQFHLKDYFSSLSGCTQHPSFTLYVLQPACLAFLDLSQLYSPRFSSLWDVLRTTRSWCLHESCGILTRSYTLPVVIRSYPKSSLQLIIVIYFRWSLVNCGIYVASYKAVILPVDKWHRVSANVDKLMAALLLSRSPLKLKTWGPLRSKARILFDLKASDQQSELHWPVYPNVLLRIRTRLRRGSESVSSRL